MNSIKKISTNFFFILIILLSLFGRSLTGIYVFGYRLGEIIIAVAFLLSLTLLVSKPNLIYNKKLNFLVIHKIIFSSFLLIVLTNLPIKFSPYLVKSSSYIWITIFLYIGFHYFSNINYEHIFVTIFPTLIIIIYILQTTYYPESLSNFFTNYSDKFEYLKAGDILLVFVISTLMIQKRYFNNFNFFAIFLVLTALFIPYFLYASKGAFLSLLIYCILQFKSVSKYLFKFRMNTFFVIMFSIVIFSFSTFHIYGNFVFEKSSQDDSQVFIPSEIIEGIVAIAEERNTSQTFASLYVENSRIYSIDATANWRLQIWQDVIWDIFSTPKKLLFGYGYSEIIPAMDDKERRGSDGTNENVHNYFVNILARGGMLQVFLFASFHILIVKQFKEKFGNLSILKFVIPVFVVSFFDTSMESVRFPLLYYSFLGYFLNEDSIYLQ